MRKQVSYNDDLSLLGQRVRPIQPRIPATTNGDRYRLYAPTSGDHHQQHRSPDAPSRHVERNVNFAPAKPTCNKSRASSKPVARVKPTYALKINNVDDVTVPVSGGYLMKISEAHSVQELRGLLHTCTGPTSSSAAPVRPLKASPAATTLCTARSAGAHVYEQCFLGHCIALRDALAGPTPGP